jgi:aspartyl/asparaginyl-tRNA synthetase
VEISTGAQREHRIEVLEQLSPRRKLDPRRHSLLFGLLPLAFPPHGGFRHGTQLRLLMLLLHQSNLRGHLPVPRANATPAVVAGHPLSGRSRRSLRQRDRSCASGG